MISANVIPYERSEMRDLLILLDSRFPYIYLNVITGNLRFRGNDTNTIKIEVKI